MDKLSEKYYKLMQLREKSREVLISATEDSVNVGCGKVKQYKENGELHFQKTLKMKPSMYMERKSRIKY